MSNFNNIAATVDFIVPFGPSCRPADALRRNNLRYFSSPFDWLADIELSAIIYLFESDFRPFFKKYRVYAEFPESGMLGVMDLHTGLKSVHFFRISFDVEDQCRKFIQLMRKRFERLLQLINKCEKFAVINNKELQLHEICSFMDYFHNRFNKSIIFINIINSRNEEKVFSRQYGYSTIHQAYFNDTHPEYRQTSNPGFWKGNVYLWDELLQKIKLNEEFCSANRQEAS